MQKNSRDWSNVYDILNRIYVEWVLSRIREVMCDKDIPDVFGNALEKNIIPIFIDDLKFFIEHVIVVKYFSEDELNKKYKRLVFENAQGLAISQEYYKYGENTTPTITGIKSALDAMNSINLNAGYDIELCYVTRWYTTRHGAGCLPNETDVNNISRLIVDNTNVYNEWQGSIRYALLSIESISYRIIRDLMHINQLLSNNLDISIAINCIDQSESDNIPFMINGVHVLSSIYDMASLILESIKSFKNIAPNKTGSCCYLGYSDDSKYTKKIYM